ncbi:hypothetical protein N7470_002175 [Penicillium chermesinum]|nr:hypothetical protein N7470_002175 [Penicillium chermesinum]
MSQTKEKRPVFIAGCSGGCLTGDPKARPAILTDRRPGTGSVLSSQIPKLDAIVGDWMSEADMTQNGAKRTPFKNKLQNVNRLGEHLAANGTKVVCNAGGGNAHGLAEAVKELVALEKLNLRVGWIEGDDVTEAVKELIASNDPLTNLTTGKSFSSWGREMISRAWVPQEDPISQDLATVDCRIFAQAPNAELLGPDAFLTWCKMNILQSCPGLTPTLDSRQGIARPYYEYWVALIEQQLVQERAHLPNGESVLLPPPQNTAVYPALQASQDMTADPLPGDSWGPVKKAPLGFICLGRSGDKSSDANLGLFVRHVDEWDWLRGFLSNRRLQELLGRDYPGKPILRFELPHLRAVHFLLKDHLDRGYNAGGGLDTLGRTLRVAAAPR